MLKYSINIKWSDEDECYIALIPELPGLSAFGDTPEEAIKEATIAAKGFLKVYEEDGDPIPEPKKMIPYSGQTRLRMPKSLHASLVEGAEAECVSLNTYIVSLLSMQNERSRLENELSKIKELIMLNNLNVELKLPESKAQTQTFSNGVGEWNKPTVQAKPLVN